MSQRTYSLLLFLLLPFSLHAQDRTVGVLMNQPGAAPGYTLFAPSNGTTTYLIDLDGRIVRSWESRYQPGSSVYLLEDGSILRGSRAGRGGGGGGGNRSGGIVQRFDWEGDLLWEFDFSRLDLQSHHDAIMLPNGNVVAVLWEPLSREDAIALGRDPETVPENGLLMDLLMEIRPIGSDSGEIVWQWRAVDHLIQDVDETKENFGVIADHPGRLDFNRATADPRQNWIHINGIDYNEDLDQIVMSSPYLNEVMIIDHSTTTEEAAGSTGGNAGRGGELIYRWGSPAAYGAEGQQQLYFQHNPNWIPEGYPGAGNLLIFNNGDGRPGTEEYSEILEITTPVQQDGSYRLAAGSAWGPADPLWSYTAPVKTDFYSARISGARRLPNGNTLICEGQSGRFFEVTSDGEMVWEYVNPVIDGEILEQGAVPAPLDNSVFRAERYSPDHPAFEGRELVPGEFVERYTNSVESREPEVETLTIE